MFYRFAALFLMLLLIPGVSFSEDADRLEKRFESREPPKSGFGSALPPLAQRAAAGRLRQSLALERVEIVGSTVYADKDLEPILESYRNRPASPELVEELTEEIAKKYEADGYPYTQVSVEPPKTPTGAPRIVIREAYIDNVIIQGEFQDKKGRFASLAEKIKAVRPVYKPTLERYLLLANDLAGIYKVEASIEASEENPGAHTLTLQVTPMKTTSGFVYLDNRGTDAVGPSTIVPGAFISNPFGYFGKTSILAATTAQPKELRYLSVKYELPVNEDGTIVQAKVSYNKSYPGNMEAIDFSSASSTLSLGVEHPFLRTQQKNFTGYGKFDVKYSNTRNDMNAGLLTNTTDETRVLRVGGDFDYTDSTKAITRLQVEWSHGLDAMGANSDNLTSDGVVDFDKVRYSLSRTQPLTILSPKLDKWTLYGAVEGQISSDPLLSAEECGIGGADFGRAYDASEITGDRCIKASAELGRSFDTSGIDWLKSGSGYLFYDIGEVRERGIETPEQESISSAGIGMEFQTSESVNFTVELAKPLTKEVTNENDKDLRVFGTVTILF
uniref:Hemolysin activation/secretion protein n=1 Tax=Candidatus Kentrum sp. DK TaxID=2126562 RepID=A0A450TB22_9GAMM|nr:MAG: Hemolysin activation/secretion protein [Candidatus Kentron sp. DK]